MHMIKFPITHIWWSNLQIVPNIGIKANTKSGKTKTKDIVQLRSTQKHSVSPITETVQKDNITDEGPGQMQLSYLYFTKNCLHVRSIPSQYYTLVWNPTKRDSDNLYFLVLSEAAN